MIIYKKHERVAMVLYYQHSKFDKSWKDLNEVEKYRWLEDGKAVVKMLEEELTLYENPSEALLPN